jgi:hypothetical protein
MEQCPVVRFFTLKGLSPKDIHTELESVYMNEALCLRTVYKRHERFMQFHAKENRAIWWSAIRMTFAEWSRRGPSCYDSGILFYFVQASLYPLQTHNEYLFAYLTRCFQFKKVQKGSIYDGSRTLSMTLERPKGCHFPQTFWRFSKKIKRKALLRL